MLPSNTLQSLSPSWRLKSKLCIMVSDYRLNHKSMDEDLEVEKICYGPCGLQCHHLQDHSLFPYIPFDFRGSVIQPSSIVSPPHHRMLSTRVAVLCVFSNPSFCHCLTVSPASFFCHVVHHRSIICLWAVACIVFSLSLTIVSFMVVLSVFGLSSALSIFFSCH